VTQFASVRLARQLNAMINSRTDAGRAAAVVTGTDVAHHVLDPEGLCGLDPSLATDLVEALPRVADREAQGWLLALPAPGRLSVLRGPATLNQAAVAAGSAVVGVSAGLALVPTGVGPAVQWRVHRAEPPAPPPTPSEAERALSEVILSAERTLARLDVAAGPTPALVVDLGPANGYPLRRLAAADRAARLLVASAAALDDEGGTLSSYEVLARRRELEAVQAAARDALTAAVS
jgi:hypothetical protein